jgi:hypothetical protein
MPKKSKGSKKSAAAAVKHKSQFVDGVCQCCVKKAVDSTVLAVCPSVGNSKHDVPMRVFQDLCGRIVDSRLDRLHGAILVYMLYDLFPARGGSVPKLCRGVVLSVAKGTYALTTWVRYEGVDYDLALPLRAADSFADAGRAGFGVCASGRVRGDGSLLLMKGDPGFSEVVHERRYGDSMKNLVPDLTDELLAVHKIVIGAYAHDHFDAFVASLHGHFCSTALEMCLCIRDEFCERPKLVIDERPLKQQPESEFSSVLK